MIFKSNIIEEIKFSHIKSVHSTSEEQMIDEIKGIAIIVDDDDVEKNVGEIRAYYVDNTNRSSSIHLDLDCISSSLEEFAQFFDDQNQIEETIYKTLNITDKRDRIFDNDGVLILDMVYVEKDFRGSKIGQLLIDNLCNDYQRRSRFALLKAFPLQYEGSTNPERLEEKKRKANEEDKIFFKNRDEDASEKKLIQLYKQSGFRIIKGTKNFMVCDLNEKLFE